MQELAHLRVTKVSITTAQVTHLTSLIAAHRKPRLVRELPFIEVRSCDAGRRENLCRLTESAPYFSQHCLLVLFWPCSIRSLPRKILRRSTRWIRLNFHRVSAPACRRLRPRISFGTRKIQRCSPQWPRSAPLTSW